MAQDKFALQISDTLNWLYHFLYVFQHCWGLIYVLSLQSGKYNGFLIIPSFKEQMEGSPDYRQSRKRIGSYKEHIIQSCLIKVFQEHGMAFLYFKRYTFISLFILWVQCLFTFFKMVNKIVWTKLYLYNISE